MKKLFLLLTCLFAILSVSCSKDEPTPTSATVKVNVYLEEVIASPSLVKLFLYDDAKYFDTSYKGALHYGTYRKLIDINGKEIDSYISSSQHYGVNHFSDIPNGKYIIVVMHKPDGFTYENFYFYGYKIIEVKGETELYEFDFNYKHRLSECKGFIKF